MLLALVLSLGSGGLLLSLLEDPRARSEGAARALNYFLLCVFVGQALSWVLLRSAPAHALLPALSRPGFLWRGALALAAGLAAFLSLRRTAAAAGRGLLAGLVCAALGYWAHRWLEIAQAWKLIGGFSGTFVFGAAPLALAASAVLAALAFEHPDFIPSRATFAAALLLAWSLPAELALWRLETAWSYGPQTLSQAAGLPPAEQAEEVSVAWLRPVGGSPYNIEPRRMAAEGVDASVESLDKLYAYLKRTSFRSVFSGQALKALRNGWLLWWDSDRALEAEMLSRPGRAAPDYRGALALLRAGPLTVERFEKLRALSALGKPRREGFEDVTQSQYIFEAFSSAYARFGDEEGARSWLSKVDNLWPIYEKKIEVSPLESLHDGEVSGTLLLDGKAAASVMVGLFYVTSATGAAVSTGTLSGSDFPDAASGQFRFTSLGMGRYFLALQGHPSQLKGAVSGSPGVFQISVATPTVRLPEIEINP